MTLDTSALVNNAVVLSRVRMQRMEITGHACCPRQPMKSIAHGRSAPKSCPFQPSRHTTRSISTGKARREGAQQIKRRQGEQQSAARSSAGPSPRSTRSRHPTGRLPANANHGNRPHRGGPAAALREKLLNATQDAKSSGAPSRHYPNWQKPTRRALYTYSWAARRVLRRRRP